MNKKGFTLIELLATIILLCLVTLVATFTINKSIKDAKNKSHNSQVDTILSAAITYTNESEDITLSNINGYKIYLSALVSGGYIAKDIKDPLNNKEFNMNSSYVQITVPSTVTNPNSDTKDYKYNGKYLYTFYPVYK